MWTGSHHDVAMQVPAADAVLGDFDDASFEHRGRTTKFFRAGSAYAVETEGPQGGTETYEIAYTFGAHPLQQYLVAFPDGRLQALDVAWDSRSAESGGQRWFALQPMESPGPGDPLHWTGIAYTWNFMCAECHSTNVQKNYDLAADTYDTSFSEVDVSCEACHGPSSVHVSWAEAREEARASESAPAPESGGAAEPQPLTAAEMGLQVGFPRMVEHSWDIDPETGLATRNPEGAPAPDVEACGRCHARRGVFAEGYEFGSVVADTYRVSLLEDGLYFPDGQIRDEVFVYGSFVQSRMYQRGVGCGDCHDAHSLAPYNDGNALCNRCHLGEKFDTREHHRHEVGTEGSRCVDCHMPSTTYMVVDPRRDHSFRSPRPDLSLLYEIPNACRDCHLDEGDAWAAAAVERWFGPERPPAYGARLAAGRSAGRGAGSELLTLARDPSAPGIVRATALAELSPASQPAINAMTTALESDDPLVRGGALSGLTAADPTTVLRVATPALSDPVRSVRLEAARLFAAIPRQQVPPAQRPAVDAVIEEYRDAQRVNEDRAEAHLNLGWLALQQGDLVAAEREYLTARRLEPMFVPAFINLADLYRLTGRDIEGEGLLRSALDVAPDSGDVHYALGLLLVRTGRSGEATSTLGRAAELAPGNPHYAYVYAVAIQDGGETERAIDLLDRSLQRFPDDPQLLLAAAAFSRDIGALDRAVAYARRLVEATPDDPQAAAFLRQLEELR